MNRHQKSPGLPEGAIALAAYEPDPVLLERQLHSLQAQTVREWTCVISVDGDPLPVRELVASIVGDDERFVVIGDGSRLGFYGNFERALGALPESAQWVALCDQDDYWYENKLAELVPHLEKYDLVSGQARLVEYPSGRTLGSTDRVDNGADFILLNNQYTGSACVLRTTLLDLALPFPHVKTKTAAHDHWLAVCAGASNGAIIIEQELQHYVQHGGNVFGDPNQPVRRASANWADRLRTNVLRYEDEVTVGALLRWYFWFYVGWRQVLADVIEERLGQSALSPRGHASFSSKRRLLPILRLLREGRRRGAVGWKFSIEYLISWIAGSLSGGRKRAKTLASTVGEQR